MILPVVILLLLDDVYVVDVMSTFCNMRTCYLADVIANLSVVDAITTKAGVIVCYILFVLVCCCQYVADVMATFSVMWWQILIPSSSWNGHCRVDGNYGG